MSRTEWSAIPRRCRDDPKPTTVDLEATGAEVVVPAPNVARHSENHSARLCGDGSLQSAPNGQRVRQQTGSGRVLFPAWSSGSVAHRAYRSSCPSEYGMGHQVKPIVGTERTLAMLGRSPHPPRIGRRLRGRIGPRIRSGFDRLGRPGRGWAAVHDPAYWYPEYHGHRPGPQLRYTDT